MSLREFGFYIAGYMSVVVIDSRGLLIGLYDGTGSVIPDTVLDREVKRITSAQINTIWIEVE